MDDLRKRVSGRGIFSLALAHTIGATIAHGFQGAIEGGGLFGDALAHGIGATLAEDVKSVVSEHFEPVAGSGLFGDALAHGIGATLAEDVKGFVSEHFAPVGGTEAADLQSERDALQRFFTLQKIVYYGPPPAMTLRPSAVEIFKLPPDAPRLRNQVLGYHEVKKASSAPVQILAWL